MNFQYAELESAAPPQPADITRVISKLCGEEIRLSPRQAERVQQAINSVECLEYEQLNEILLIVGQDRVSRHFFDYFFGEAALGDTPRARLRAGIIKFCGFAMLCYGNFRFAYKELSQVPPDRFQKVVFQYDENKGSERFGKIGARGTKTIDITPINRSQTWFTGYLSPSSLEKDRRNFWAIRHRLGLMSKPQIELEVRPLYQARFRNVEKVEEETKKAVKGIIQRAATIKADVWKTQLDEISGRLEQLRTQLEQTRETAKANTETYLTWEHMDVYFATSMRHRWEFEAVYDFIRDIFAQNPLERLPLRYFDPTQSFSHNRIDKGLVEGLMLNRAFLTVYLAQESDTLGKDSELASTLAQGKPVIAHVPQVDENYWRDLPSQPLDFFLKRAFLLLADEAFKDEVCFTDLAKRFGANVLETLGNHVDVLSDHIANRTFYLVGREDVQFKEERSDAFKELCGMIGICEKHYFNRRAYTLSHVHPLAVQVDLRNGVANGVLVTRDAYNCSSLISEVLSNSMSFSIIESEGVTELREKRSKCPYRVVTSDRTLENSFWNFYLTERTRGI